MSARGTPGVLPNRQGNPTLDWLSAPVVGAGRRRSTGLRWKLFAIVYGYVNLALAAALWLQ